MLCGPPCSGKTTRAKQLLSHFQSLPEVGPSRVFLISDDELFGENREEAYATSLVEKQTRGKVKAATERLVTRDNIIICDSMNYIKGFRYELYCVARAQRTTHCVVYCNVDYETISHWNRSRKIWKNEQLLRELTMRVEVPNEKARWDHPLFRLGPSDETPLTEIQNALLNPTHKPKPNLSTLPLLLSDTTLLYELDKTTNAIISELMAQKSILMPGDLMSIADTDERLRMPGTYVTMPELRKLRSQYVRVAQMHPPSTKTEIAKQFVLFLNLHMGH